MRFDTSIKPDFMRLTGNNQSAWDFVDVFARRSHLIDDIIDGDADVSDEEIIKSEIEWMATLSRNPFYMAHSNYLMPLIISGATSWLDANEWEQSEDPVKRTHSDVIKSTYHEVIFGVVYLCGGWNALREFTQLHREYQKDNYHGNVCTGQPSS